MRPGTAGVKASGSGRPSPATGSDHPIRRRALWQIIDRLWRPAAGWMVVTGTAYAGWLGPMIERPMAEAYLLT